MLGAVRSPCPSSEMPETRFEETANRLEKPPGRHSDAEILAQLRDGNREALTSLHERHASLLLSLALRILHNRHDAEEVVQEAFLYAWKRAASYDPERSSVSSWLAVIVRSRSLDRLRSCQRAETMRTEVERDENRPRTFPSEGFSHVLRQERAVRVRQAVAGLPPAQRQVLEISYYQGRTQKEVAELIGVPLGTVKTRTFLAMKKLRRELEEELGSLV